MVARIGVIGVGWWATRAHLPALKANPFAEISALADPDPLNLSEAANYFGVQSTYTSAEAMFDQETLDGVIIATPHSSHYELCAAALENSAHVLVEKPMVLDPTEGKHLIREARARALELIVGYPWHFNRQVLAARDWLAGGRIGEPLLVQCLYASVVWDLYRGRPSSYRDVLGYPLNEPRADTYSSPEIAGGGQAQTQVTHSAALMFFVTGLKAAEVYALMENHDLQVDLVDAITVRFEGGCLGLMGSTGSTVRTQPELLEYRFYGTEGHVFFDAYGGRLTLHSGTGDVIEGPSVPAADIYPESAPANNLVDVVLGRAANGSPGELGLQAAAFVHAAYRSANDRRPYAP